MSNSLRIYQRQQIEAWKGNIPDSVDVIGEDNALNRKMRRAAGKARRRAERGAK